MRRPEFIAKQGRHPTGLLGSLLAWIMAIETTAENTRALELLELRPEDQVLEIGFGHGRTVTRAAAMASRGFVAGVDVSERMVQMASAYNRSLIREGRVELKLGDSSCLPYANRRFDKVYSVHTAYFWANPTVHLQEIGRVMKEGARLVLGFRTKDQRAFAEFPSTVYRFYTAGEVQSFLEEAGYACVQIVETQFSKRRVVFAAARRPV